MSEPGIDGTPAWAYDEDGYCVACGSGRWKYHRPVCKLRDALDDLAALTQAAEPFVAFFQASMASRTDQIRDSVAVAIVSNNIDGDTPITVGDLRRLAAAVGTEDDDEEEDDDD